MLCIDGYVHLHLTEDAAFQAFRENHVFTLWYNQIILKAVVEYEKAVQARKFKNCVVTLWVMSQF